MLGPGKQVWTSSPPGESFSGRHAWTILSKLVLRMVFRSFVASLMRNLPKWPFTRNYGSCGSPPIVSLRACPFASLMEGFFTEELRPKTIVARELSANVVEVTPFRAYHHS